MKKVWDKIKIFLNAIKGFILPIVGLIIVIFFSKNIGDLIKSFLGKVDKPVSWIPIPGDKNHILVKKEDGSYDKAELPYGVQSNNVDAVGYVEGGPIEVQIKHEVVDRKSSSGDAVSDSASAHWPRD